MLHSHLALGTSPGGSFPWSLQEPPVTSSPCYEAGRASPHAPLILALQKLLDLRQDCRAQVQLPQGAKEGARNECPQCPALHALPTPPTVATYAFWLTMLRRSTTTDRSLMATAESTDVCANRAPVREDWGQSGP